MADNEQDLTLRLQFVADTKAADEASKKIDDLGKKSDDAGDKQKKASESAKEFGKSSGRAAEMVGSLTGALGQASPAAAQLGAGLRVIKALAEGSGAGLMGLATILVGVGVSAWAAYKRKVEESKKQMSEMLNAMTDSKIAEGQKQIDKVAESFGRVEKAISAARSAQSELAAAWQDLNKAGQEVTAMQIEQREKAEMAALSPDDAAGAAKVKAKYIGIREAGSVGQRAGDSFRAEQAAQDDLAAASAHRSNIEQSLDNNTQLRDLINNQIIKSRDRADSLNNPDAEDRHRAYKEVVDFGEQLAALNKTILDLNDSLIASKTSERAAVLKLDAAGIRSTQGVSAAQTLAEQNTSDAELAATRAAWAQRLTDMRSRVSSDASQFSTRATQYRGNSDSYNPQRADYSDDGEWRKAHNRDQSLEKDAKRYEQLAENAKKLSEQMEKMKPEQLASVFATITKQMEALENAFKNAEQRSKHQ